LTQARLVELARELGVSIPAGRKDAQIAKLLERARLPLPAWLGNLVRDELRVACREHGVDASSRSRSELAGALLDAAGLPRGRDTIPPIFEEASARDLLGKDFIRKCEAPGKPFAEFDHDDYDALAERPSWELSDIDKLSNVAFQRIYKHVADS
jgi:hypothetical protein